VKSLGEERAQNRARRAVCAQGKGRALVGSNIGEGLRISAKAVRTLTHLDKG